MGAGTININYDMQVLIDYFVQLFQTFWPIIALGLGIILAAFLIGALSRSFLTWIRERY